jgi:two-component system, NtrC family, response regulator HydG
MSETTLDPRQPLPREQAGLPAARLYFVVQDVVQRLLREKEPAGILQTFWGALVEHLQPEQGCLLEVSTEGSYRPVGSHSLDLKGPPDEWPLSQSVLHRAYDSQLAVLTHEPTTDFAGSQSIARLGIRSVMCVPMGQNPVRGLVYLDNRTGRTFTIDDLACVAAVSSVAASALERAEEYTRISTALERTDERLAILQEGLRRHKIVGRSPLLLAAYDQVRKYARNSARVLLLGETGTGKELFARAYAEHTGRKNYVPVDIPSINRELIESELFGHVRGAFTGAIDRTGRLEAADKGVVFLDEIGDIPPEVQVKLLRFLESGEFVRVGDNTMRHVDVLVVSATNRPLEKDVADGRFRADLRARLGQVVRLPPLRDRPEDIPLLIEHFIQLKSGGRPRTFSPEAIELMKRRRWPLNVRELATAVESPLFLFDDDVIRPEHLGIEPETGGPAGTATSTSPHHSASLDEVVERAEKAHIEHVLQITGGHVRKSIEMLGISNEKFYQRLHKYGLKDKDS